MPEIQPPDEHSYRSSKFRQVLSFLARVYVQPFRAGGVWAMLHGFVLVVSALCLLTYLRHGGGASKELHRFVSGY